MIRTALATAAVSLALVLGAAPAEAVRPIHHPQPTTTIGSCPRPIVTAPVRCPRHWTHPLTIRDLLELTTKGAKAKRKGRR